MVESNALAYDVIIAGGGVAGVLTAARLAMARPELKIALLERETTLGGRLRAAATSERAFGYGLNGISDGLFEYWAQTLKQDPEGPDLATLVPRRQQRAGVLAGNRITQVEIAEWFTPKGARTLGGFAASRQWPEIEDILKSMPALDHTVASAPKTVQKAAAALDIELEADSAAAAPVAVEASSEPNKKKARVRAGAKAAKANDPVEDEGAEVADKEEGDDRHYPFSHYWKNTRKAPAAVVVEHFGSAYGIPDVWAASVDALAERAGFHASSLHSDVWDEALRTLLDLPAVKQAVTVHTNCRIVNADRIAGKWMIDAEGGTYEGDMLVVAQPPWQAVLWLARAVWPPQVLQLATKTKPVSAVVLSEKILDTSVELPDVVVVPSEKVQIIRVSKTELCFQATIDYELTVQAPAVIKAVKALKRARKKLLILHPGVCDEANKIALQNVAWAQSPLQADRRYLTKLEKKPFNTATLSFVGDAYGAHYDGDRNILSSLHAAVEAVTAHA